MNSITGPSQRTNTIPASRITTMPESSAIVRRRGGQSQSRRIPWEYVMFVLVAMFMVFFFLYVRALDQVLHGDGKGSVLNHQHPDREAMESSASKEVLILTTKLGDVKIKLNEELSKSSVGYIRQMVAAGECPRCSFYRAEAGGILQGIIKNPDLKDMIKVGRGDCPQDLLDSKWKDNCHGPIMSHGTVGWAAGKTGPDFFIDWYKRPTKYWGAQHTVWGIVEDDASAQVIADIWKLPVNQKGGLSYLEEPIKFEMALATEE